MCDAAPTEEAPREERRAKSRGQSRKKDKPEPRPEPVIAADEKPTPVSSRSEDKGGWNGPVPGFLQFSAV